MRTLYLASRVHTLSAYGGGEWLLVDERHVERVGTGAPPEADRVVEIPGTTILPGFVDAHVHLSGTGLQHEGLDLSQARSREDLLERVRAHIPGHEGPVLARGFDESGWDEPEIPTGPDLAGVTQEPLILIRTDSYLSVANERALEASGALEEEGAERGQDGRPTGVLRGKANERAQRWWYGSLPESRIQDAQLRTAGLAAARGVTCVHEMATPDKQGRRDVEVLLRHLEDLPLDCVVYIADMDIPYVMERAFPRVGGDLFLDGSIGARTAAVLQPYEGSGGSGELEHDEEELVEFLHNAHLAGMQVGLHCIGDAAIEQALGAWERVYGALDSRGRRHFRARRHRLEHFEMASVHHVERAAALGLAASIQPAFDATWGHQGGMYEARLGRERAWGMNPFHTMLARGLELGAGSDTPVTPLDPMEGIWALETHHDATQRLARQDAIRLYTTGAARLAHLEKKGKLEPGSAADFAAYEADPFDVPDVRGLRPVLTVSRGRDVYVR